MRMLEWVQKLRPTNTQAFREFNSGAMDVTVESSLAEERYEEVREYKFTIKARTHKGYSAAAKIVKGVMYREVFQDLHDLQDLISSGCEASEAEKRIDELLKRYRQ